MKDFNDGDRNKIDKNYKAKKTLICGVEPNNYNWVLAYKSTEEVEEALENAHEGMSLVKKSKIYILHSTSSSR